MLQRWFLIDFRYLSIWVTYETPVDPHDFVRARYLFDISLRPLVAFHIASVWNGFPRCVDFAIVITSFASMTIATDLLDTDETCTYPAPGFPGALDLACALWAYFVFECRVHTIWIRGHICHRLGIVAMRVKTAFVKIQRSLANQHRAGA